MLSVALKFPGENGGEVFVVAPRFAVRRLMFFAEMSAARFISRERIRAHQFGEFQKISNTSGPFKRLIEFLPGTRHVDVRPEFFTQRRNFLERFPQSFGVARHAAFVPQHQAQLAMD